MKVFGEDVLDMHNTHNGEYPGHVRAGEHPRPADPVDPHAPKEAGSETSAAQKPKEAKANSASDAAAQALAPDISAAANVEVGAENMGKVEDNGIEISDNYMDAEYLQTSSSQSTSKLAFYINVINSPEDLGFLQVTKTRKAWNRRLADADGDGVEDNEKFSHDTLDEFYDPLVFGVAEDVHNTHHGNLPGHKQLEFTLSQGEPRGHWQDIV